ncbi:hypothetical protein R3P38DRAFT_2849581, partial [Favolaschia claudopus]
MLKKLFTKEKRMPWNLHDIFPTSSTMRNDLDVYLWLVRETAERPWAGDAHPAATQLESMKLYRTAVGGYAYIICRLRHPACPHFPITLMFSRFREGGTRGEIASEHSPASGLALDRVAVTTTRSEAEHLVKKDHSLYWTLTFPTATKPTLFDLLALVELVSAKNKTYGSGTPGSSVPQTPLEGGASGVFYGTAIYCAMQRLFDGKSVENPACRSDLAAFLGLVDTYDRKIQDVTFTFPIARREFDTKGANARLAAMGDRILKAELSAGFLRQLESKIVLLKNQKDAEMSRRRASLKEKTDAHLERDKHLKKKEVRISFQVGGEKEREEILRRI